MISADRLSPSVVPRPGVKMLRNRHLVRLASLFLAGWTPVAAHAQLASEPIITTKAWVARLGDQGQCDRLPAGVQVPPLDKMILELRFADRILPHEASSFLLAEGLDLPSAPRFKSVKLPDNYTCTLRYEAETGRLYAEKFLPDHAPAFPTAEGFGKYTVGGRGGQVLIVTNLNDDGPGSLRAACLTSGPRTIVFEVSGTIELKSRLNITEPFLTIAGQTAPGDGICVRSHEVTIDADHVIVRYLRFRPGDLVKTIEPDGLGGRGNHLIIDHCSVSWSIDETLSFNQSANISVQWCFVTESLARAHHSKGPHGYGGLWGGPGASYHHNLLAHHTNRSPRVSGNANSGLLDYRNNVIYNWGGNSSYGGELWGRNWIGNYYKAGPATRESVARRLFIQDNPRGRKYVSNNVLFGAPDITADNWLGIHYTEKGQASYATLHVATPFIVAPVATDSAEVALEKVLAHGGASLRRDAVDRRIVEEVRSGTATYGETFGGGKRGIIDSQTAVGGWPELVSLPAPLDSDRDGLPDEWELTHQLDPRDPMDSRRSTHPNGYTHLELYLNALAP